MDTNVSMQSSTVADNVCVAHAQMYETFNACMTLLICFLVVHWSSSRLVQDMSDCKLILLHLAGMRMSCNNMIRCGYPCICNDSVVDHWRARMTIIQKGVLHVAICLGW